MKAAQSSTFSVATDLRIERLGSYQKINVAIIRSANLARPKDD
jgi:hypothetical protein